MVAIVTENGLIRHKALAKRGSGTVSYKDLALPGENNAENASNGSSPFSRGRLGGGIFHSLIRLFISVHGELVEPCGFNLFAWKQIQLFDKSSE